MGVRALSLAFLLAVVPFVGQADERFGADATRRTRVTEVAATQAEFTFLLLGGQYYLLDWEALALRPVRVTVLVPPGPIPPGPQPKPDPPKPDPTPQPVPPGPRQLLLIRESGDATPSLARLIVGLRSGAGAAYLTSKAHTLSVLDDDAQDSEGRPSSLIMSWKDQILQHGLPLLVITDKAGTTLYAGKLEATATSDTVLNKLKEHGG